MMPTEGPFSDLSVSHRVLLWLYETRSSVPRFSMPAAFTQKGISTAVGASQNFVSVILKQLVFEGRVIESKWHVEGLKRKMKVFQITSIGVSEAQQIAEQVKARRIRITIGGKQESVKIGDYLHATKQPVLLTRIIFECLRRGYYSAGTGMQPERDTHNGALSRLDALIGNACQDLAQEMKKQ